MSVMGYIRLKKLLKNSYTQLLIAAILQTGLASLNVYQIANGKYLQAAIVGFFILLIWSYNVKKIAFGTLLDRIVYSIGGSIGTGLGIIIGLELYI
jgi:hypothetical protein